MRPKRSESGKSRRVVSGAGDPDNHQARGAATVIQASTSARSGASGAEDNPIDGEWVREVVDRFSDPLVRYANRLLQGDWERARDVVQDVFVRLCRAEKSDVESHLAEWLYTVCRNRSLDVLRKERRMNVLSVIEGHDRDDGGGTTSSAPGSDGLMMGRRGTVGVSVADDSATGEEQERALSQPESLSQALRALAGLPVNQQEVIRLKFQAGLSYKEISRVTELSVSNVGFLIHTGLKTLRAQLAAAGEDSPSSQAQVSAVNVRAQASSG